MWMNVTCLVGRAASEPKRRTTNNGAEYVTLRVAVRRSADHTDFFTVELWGRLASVALRQVTIGRMLSLRCELRQLEWNEAGERKERMVLAVRKLGFLSAHGDAAIGVEEAA